MPSKKYQLVDNHGRPMNYLRLSVTDRCNLRCFYCMPENGIKYLPKSEILSYEEMERIVGILANMGISKIRITGGEPFVRKDLIPFLHKISSIEGIDTINITSNGVLLSEFLHDLKELNVGTINLSLDTLDEKRFRQITRRNNFKEVMHALHMMISLNFQVKLNAVIMKEINEVDILPLVEFTKNHPISVRFIEEMPFNGSNARKAIINHEQILEVVRNQYKEALKKIPDPAYSTSSNYQVSGYKGTMGIIPAFTRTFCGSCNRLRITAQGKLKTCLYDGGVLDIKKILREGATDTELRDHFLFAIRHRAKDGFEAENQRIKKSPYQSMSTIGG